PDASVLVDLCFGERGGAGDHSSDGQLPGVACRTAESRQEFEDGVVSSPAMDIQRVLDLLQWVAVVFGVAEVLLAWKNKILLYPAGIISTVLTIYIYAASKLYAESVLNGYYFVMSIYGWWHWYK